MTWFPNIGDYSRSNTNRRSLDTDNVAFYQLAENAHAGEILVAADIEDR